MDFNDGFGISDHDEEPNFTGPCRPSKEHYVSSSLRGLLAPLGYIVFDSFFNHAPTFFGEGWTSNPDHVIVHSSNLPMIRSCSSWLRLGKQIQLVDSKKDVDHRPLVLKMHCKLDHDSKNSSKQRSLG